MKAEKRKKRRIKASEYFHYIIAKMAKRESAGWKWTIKKGEVYCNTLLKFEDGGNGGTCWSTFKG